MSDEKVRVAVSWSTGKDSALGLKRVLEDERYEVKVLYTNFSSDTERSSIHGINEELVDSQADRIGIPFEKFFLEPSNMEDYREEMKSKLEMLKEKYGIEGVVHSDIFLELAKNDKQEILQEAGLEGIWPIWNEDTSKLLREFGRNFSGTIICVNPEKGPEELLGKELTTNTLSEFPETDPCGEKGEFHSLVTDAPYFSKPLKIRKGKKVEKNTEDGKSIYQDMKPFKTDIISGKDFAGDKLVTKLEEKGFEAESKEIEFTKNSEMMRAEIKSKIDQETIIGHCFAGTMLLQMKKEDIVAIDPPNLDMENGEIKVEEKYREKIIASEEAEDRYDFETEIIQNSKHDFNNSMDSLAGRIENKLDDEN